MILFDNIIIVLIHKYHIVLITKYYQIGLIININ